MVCSSFNISNMIRVYCGSELQRLALIGLMERKGYDRNSFGRRRKRREKGGKRKEKKRIGDVN